LTLQSSFLKSFRLSMAFIGNNKPTARQTSIAGA